MTNTTSTNYLEYAGIVTLSQRAGNKKINIAKVHNAGGLPLFNFFADCLLGDFNLAILNRPAKIMLLKISEDEDTGIVSINKATESGFRPLLNVPEKLNYSDKSAIRYSFMVPYDVVSGTTFNAIGLYPASATEAQSDIENPAAYCTLNLAKTSISRSSALLIDWELYISNKQTVKG